MSTPAKRVRPRGRPAADPVTDTVVRTKGWWHPLALVAAVVAAYANSLQGPFILDDLTAILHNPRLGDWAHPWQLLVQPAELSISGRPLVALSFAINRLLSGTDVGGYHLVNVALHLAAALLLYAVARRLLGRGTWTAGTPWAPADLAFGIALLWAVHPLNSEAVDYLSQRTEVLMGLLYFAMLAASARSFDDGTAWWAGPVAVAACAMGMLSKESMVTAPLAAVAGDAFTASVPFRDVVRRRWRLYAALAGTWLLLVAVMWGNPRTLSAGFASGVSPYTYLLNQAPMVTRYLRLVFWPTDLVVDYGWPQARTLPDVWPYALAVGGLLAASAYGVWRRTMWGALGAWFFLTLAPTSSVVPIATEVGAERRMYLPLAGVMALVVAGVALAWGRATPRGQWARTRWSALVVVLAVAVGFVEATRDRNREYQVPLTLATLTVERWPSAPARETLGMELAAAGRHADSIVQFRAAVAGGVRRARYLLGGELLEVGQPAEAVEQLNAYLAEGLATPPLVPVARRLLGTAWAQQRRWDEAAKAFRAVLAEQPDDLEARKFLGDVLFEQQRYLEAIPEYQRYVAGRPDDGGAWTSLGAAQVRSGRSAEAIPAFRRAVAASPSSVNAYANLLQLLVAAGQGAEAEREARALLTRMPADQAVRDLVGRVLMALGQHAEAETLLTPAPPRR